jgi:hypothetical protein
VELCFFSHLQPQIVIVVLKVHMHCEACAEEIKKRILKMNGTVQYLTSLLFTKSDGIVFLLFD